MADDPRPDLPARLAHWLANHRWRVAALAVLLAAVSVLVLARHARFASDVLDLLPRTFDSVRVFKQFDREFSQARELMFAIVDESGETDLDAFVEHFAGKLRAEPWVERAMEKSPMESSDGVRDLSRLAAPLLLNLAPGDFAAALKALEPAALDARLARMRAALESGSPKAEFDLEFDPLGIVAPALKPLAGSFSIEQTRPLDSPDGTLRVVLALARQPDLGAHACQETMRRVEDFRGRVLASWDGAKPQVLVTGRTAYVGELSLKMRNDVISTLGSSLLLVAAVFWIGFRRVRPLIAILHTLLLCCVVSVAFGAFVFRELNMITIGLCAILVGLGVDFGMMLLGIYQAERDHGLSHEQAIADALRKHAHAIAFGALTTAAAFLCLLVSECAGFVQLGVLIAFGILAAAALMMTVFFVCFGTKHRPRPGDTLRLTGTRFVANVFAQPRRRALAGVVGFAVLALLGFAPFGRLQFEANPKTLEPRNSRAGEALRTIQRKLPAAVEPVLAVISAPDPEAFHAAWQRAQAHWTELVRTGRLAGANSPAAFALSPHRIAANRAALAHVDLAASRRAVEAAGAREDLSAESLRPAFGLLDALSTEPALDPRRSLPAESPWWFVIDRFLAQSAPSLGVAYLTPAQPVRDFAGKETLRAAIEVPGVEAHFSGWAYTLADLVPWAKAKLYQLSGGMIIFNAILLTFYFRRRSSIAILFAGVALAVGALLATLKFAGIPLNLFNVLAFPLVLGVGVDYGIYVVVAMRAADPQRELTTIFKPVLLSGLTTLAGFGSLATAQNPALRGLGTVCALGVGWCLAATFFFVLPLVVWRDRR
ncbi:MAG: MMPL family transporter [Chthoniobacteraceae bacterium]